MYIKKPVAKSLYDSQILIAVNNEELTIKQICEKVGSHKQTVRRQIKEDLLKIYLDEKITDKRGTTVYSVKWNRIVSDFFNYLNELAKEKKLSKEENKKLNDKIKIMSNNKFITLSLKVMFREYFRIYVKKSLPVTLEELFKETILELATKLNPDMIRHGVKMDFGRDKDFKEFMDLTYLLHSFFASERIPLDDLFYSELDKKIS